MKRRSRLKKKWNFIFLDLFLLILLVLGVYLLFKKPISSSISNTISPDKFSQIVNKKLPTPTPTPTVKPTPKPLTFAEMNTLYGPCIHLPVLMYHHVQTQAAATANKQINLTVYTDIFQSQMQYLKDRGYNVLSMNDLVNFFDSGTSIPSKSVLLTFDDGYQDFYTDAYPILSMLGFHATVFVPTGLLENPGYLNWNEALEMNSIILFANHTWSHKSVVGQAPVTEKEILTADTQLSDHGLNSPKTFAYPYGPDNISSENYLASLNYKAAFTTVNGNTLCKKQRFNLPRIRIGNSPLSNYGF